MNIKEESLKKALETCRLSELPKQFREESGEYWLEAVILTRKRDGSQSYVAGKRGVDGKIIYKADFGNMSQIAGLISVHPYVYLDKEKYMPYTTIEQKRHALALYIGGDEDAERAVDELQDNEVDYQILRIAIDAQYNSKEIAATHDNIIAAVKGNPIRSHEENDGKNADSTGTKNDVHITEEFSEEIITEENKPKRI